MGQNLGAKKPERAEQAVYQTGRYTMYYMGSIAVVFLLFARQLAAFFTADPAVQSVAADCLRFISVGNICYAWGMVLVQAFNGAGDTRTPSMINFFCYWCFQIPLAWTLAVVLAWGPRGVFAAIPAAETAMTICIAGPVPARRMETEDDLAGAKTDADTAEILNFRFSVFINLCGSSRGCCTTMFEDHGRNRASR